MLLELVSPFVGLQGRPCVASRCAHECVPSATADGLHATAGRAWREESCRISTAAAAEDVCSHLTRPATWIASHSSPGLQVRQAQQSETLLNMMQAADVKLMWLQLAGRITSKALLCTRLLGPEGRTNARELNGLRKDLQISKSFRHTHKTCNRCSEHRC